VGEGERDMQRERESERERETETDRERKRQLIEPVFAPTPDGADYYYYLPALLHHRSAGTMKHSTGQRPGITAADSGTP